MKKNIKSTIVVFAISTIICSCSKDNPAPAPFVAPSIASMYEDNTLLVIPDNGGEKTSTINVNRAGIIGDPTRVSIEVDLEATWGGEVVVELITPAGQSVGLIKRMGYVLNNSNSGDDTDFKAGEKLTFNGSFTRKLPFSTLLNNDFYLKGNYATTGDIELTTAPTTVLMTPLSTFFLNKNIEGNWKLKVYDMAAADEVKLLGWKIKFDAGALK